MAARVLVIDSAVQPLAGLSEPPRDDLIRYERADWATFRPDELHRRSADLVIPVAVPAGPSAIDLFRWLKDHAIATPTLAVLPEDGDELFHAAIDVVDDFVLWPVRASEWRCRVMRLLGPLERDEASARERLAGEMGLAKLIGGTPSFLRTLTRIKLASRSGSPVLITGETGTGKELSARAIHHLSRRHSYPFIAVDCGAVPDHLFENELFGHARGAFTSAHGEQKGLVAMADGGTLFLDEIDALSLPAQAKLLRFLQERTFKPLGADRFVRADVNVLSATNRDLEALVREKQFRSDLYFRLNVLTLHLDPLRARPEDIPLLARHFVDTVCAEQRVPRKVLSPAAVRKLVSHDWPGNARELLNVIQRAVVFSEGGSIQPQHVLSLPADAAAPGAEPCVPAGTLPPPASSFRQARATALAAFERGYVEGLLHRHGGNVTWAAREAQKDRRAFGRLAKKYGLRPRS